MTMMPIGAPAAVSFAAEPGRLPWRMWAGGGVLNSCSIPPNFKSISP